jgi:hypothetical protein
LSKSLSRDLKTFSTPNPSYPRTFSKLVCVLDGLAKFLELLNNYFKVEIGIKLLDHFASLGDEQTLIKAAQAPLEDNPDILRMARLVNIFRLLPPSASQFLVKLVGHVVEAEARLHQTAPGPFTEVLAKYLDQEPTICLDIPKCHLLRSRSSSSRGSIEPYRRYNPPLFRRSGLYRVGHAWSLHCTRTRSTGRHLAQ